MTVKFKDLIRYNINGGNVCSITDHSINMSDNSPFLLEIFVCIPVNWELEIDQEIKKLLISKIIQLSNSP